MQSQRKKALTWTLAGLGIAIIAVAAVFFVMAAAGGPLAGAWGDGAYQGRGPGYMGWGYHGFGPWMGPFMLLPLLAIFGLVGFFGSRRASHHHGYHADDAIAVLEKRFAAGEIDEAEFRKLRDVLLDGR